MLPELSPIYSRCGNGALQNVLTVFIVLMYALLSVGPAIIASTGRGMKTFLSIMIAQALWYIIFFIIMLVSFRIWVTHNDPYGYYQGRGVSNVVESGI